MNWIVLDNALGRTNCLTDAQTPPGANTLTQHSWLGEISMALVVGSEEAVYAQADLV